MIGPGWTPTRLDNREEASDEEVDLFYRGSQHAIYSRLFEEWTRDLPIDEGIMYGASPHTIPIIEEALDITRAKRILEIGFGVGCSSVMFMELSTHTQVTSIDITSEKQALAAADMIKFRFPKRFKFINEDSRFVKLIGQWDLIYIDGNHTHEYARSDIALGKELGIPYFLLDDLWSHWGPGVRPAIRDTELVLIKQWGNVGLFTPGGYHVAH
jgi:predicted O-methyltransferase YrrM